MAIGDYTFDHGLDTIDTLADRIYLCAGTPTTYSEATTGGNKALGFKSFGVGGVVTAAIGDAAPNGRFITTVPVVGGSVTNTGTADHWAIVDTANTRLLAVGTCTSIALVAGQSWNCNAFNITLPASS